MLLIAIMSLMFLPFVASGQATRGNRLHQPSGISAPLVDHHQHLFSPAKAKTVYDLPLTAIELPAELAGLVNERVHNWNNKSSLETLFIENSLYLDNQVTSQLIRTLVS